MSRRLFLERRTYRQTRLQDAARLLPVLGLILLFGPIFIRDEDAAGGPGAMSVGAASPDIAGAWVYYFSVWLGLIVLTALVSRALMGASTSEPDAAEPKGGAASLSAGSRFSAGAEEGQFAPSGREDAAAPTGREDAASPTGREGG